MDLTDELLWKHAREYTEKFGSIPASFTTTVRALKQNHQKNLSTGSKGTTPEAKFSASRLLKSKSVLAPYYFATLTLFDTLLEGQKDLAPEKLLEINEPNLTANLFTLLYYARRIKKFCPAEAWQWLEKKTIEFSEIGILLGHLVPSIGAADGVIMGTMRHLSLGVFISIDNKRFQSYKRTLRETHSPFNLNTEAEMFDSTHAHVGAILLQLMGFGVDYANAYSLALITNPEDRLGGLAGKLRLTAYYIEALYTGKEPPSLPEEQDYDISDKDMDRLVLAAEDIREDGSKYSWLLKTKNNLNRDEAPHLVHEVEEAIDAELDLERQS